MRIVDVSVIRAECLLEGVDFWQEELVRPEDVYPDRWDRHRPEGGKQTKDGWEFVTHFLQITSETGMTGTAGPVPVEVARAVLDTWAPYLKSTPDVSPRRFWDEGYRRMPHGRSGVGSLTLSAVELALWDLWGNTHDRPVLEMIGGGTRPSVPAYASMLGFTVSDLDRSGELAELYKGYGYVGQKWFFRYGPSDGIQGLRRNLKLAEKIRSVVGDEYPLMFDAWQSLDVDYAVKLAQGLTEVNALWLEEPLLPEQRAGLAKIQARTRVPIAGGEHLYSRWGHLPHLQEGLHDVVQPDLYWAGGLLETLRIASIAEAFDAKVMAHAHSANATVHFSFAQSPATTPWQEHIVRWNMVHQHLLANPVEPSEGVFERPQETGFGMTLDLSRALRWSYL